MDARPHLHGHVKSPHMTPHYPGLSLQILVIPMTISQWHISLTIYHNYKYHIQNWIRSNRKLPWVSNDSCGQLPLILVWMSHVIMLLSNIDSGLAMCAPVGSFQASVSNFPAFRGVSPIADEVHLLTSRPVFPSHLKILELYGVVKFDSLKWQP